MLSLRSKLKKSALCLPVLFLTLTGCASSPTHFASPDTDNFRYTITEGERIRTTKPEPRTMGFHERNREGRTAEIFDFTRASWSQNPTIPDDHMIAVTALDPDIRGGRLVIPIQYIEKIIPNHENSQVHHRIGGITSPLTIDVTLKGERQASSSLLHEYSSEGEFIDVIHHVRTNNNPLIDYSTLHEGDLVENFVVSYKTGTIYEFPRGQAFESAWADTTANYREILEKSSEIRAEIARKSQAQEQRIQQALSATKTVGQMICSLDRWMGVVEQVEGHRLKVRIVGKASVSGRMLLSKDIPSQFNIDTTDEGKLRWVDSQDVGVCEIDVRH